MAEKPRLLDLFARAQGSSVGYARAGFQVTALDIDAYDKHPEVHEFVKMDAKDALMDREFMAGFDIVTGSPICKDYSTLRTMTDGQYEQQIEWVRQGMVASGLPYVIENVQGARWAMRDPYVMCGSFWGLGSVCRDGEWRQLRRHRLFETNRRHWLYQPIACRHDRLTGGVYGTGGGGQQTRGYRFHPEEARRAMRIDWMSRADLSQAIPPPYTELLGKWLIEQVRSGKDN